MLAINQDSINYNNNTSILTSPIFLNIKSPEPQIISNFQQINIFISLNKQMPILETISIQPKKLKIKKKKKKIIKKSLITKKQIIINKIIKERKINAIYISSFIKSKLNKIKKIKENLILYIISLRYENAVKIQSYFRMSKVRKHFIEMFFNSSFIFYYSLNTKILVNVINKFNYFNNFEVFVNIYENSKNNNQIKRNIKMKYCPYLKLFYFNVGTQQRIIRPIYKIKFSYNEKLIIDTRYPIELNENGDSFNLLYKDMFVSRIKKPRHFIYKYNEECQKKLRKINSDDSLLSNASIIMEQIYNNEIINSCSKIINFKNGSNRNVNKKSILKKENNNSKKSDLLKFSENNKKVSFNKIIIIDNINKKIL